jgi:hypothetical protein
VIRNLDGIDQLSGWSSNSSQNTVYRSLIGASWEPSLPLHRLNAAPTQGLGLVFRQQIAESNHFQGEYMAGHKHPWFAGQAINAPSLKEFFQDLERLRIGLFHIGQ